MTNTASAGQAIPTDTSTTTEMLDREPATVYQRLRQDAPIVRLQAINRVLLTRADDVYRVKTDTDYFGSTDTQTPMQRAFGGHTLMRKDGPTHQLERAAMVGSFHSQHWCSTWRKSFEDITDQVLDQLPRSGEIDLYPALAVPLAAGYLQALLGISPRDDHQMFAWANSLIKGAMNSGFDPAVFEISDRANEEMNECFDKMIDHHRACPGPSVLSVMLNTTEPLPISQIRTNMKICIGGAVVESRDALLTVLHGLLENPDQLAYCRETNRWDLACEEGLRWVAPIQASPRIVKRDVEIRGVVLPKGETVMAVQGSANHDEDYWAEPHLFDIHRSPVAHQSFGAGTHACLGGGIYRRLVAEIVLPRLFERFPSVTKAPGHIVTFRGFAFRGPTSLPVLL